MDSSPVLPATSGAPQREAALFDGIDVGLCVIEMVRDYRGRPVDYRFVETNPAFENHSGLKGSVGRTVIELNPNHEPHWFEVYGRVAQTGEPARFVYESESLGRWFDVYAFRIPGAANGDQVAVRFLDITEQRSKEQEIARLGAESRARLAELEALLEVLPIGIGIASDPECRHIRVNGAFASVLNLDRSANASKTAPASEQPDGFKVVDDEGREVPGEALPMQVAAREGCEVRGVEFNVVHPDGQAIRLLEYAAPLFDERGRPRGSVGAFIDITERCQAEKRQRFLLMLDDAVRPLSSANEIVATSARLLGEHLEADRCAYADIEPDEDTMNITGDYNRGVPSIVGRFTFTQFGSEVLRLMRAKEPYVVEDIEMHRPSPEDQAAYRATLIRAVICVPLHKGGRFVAAMAVQQKTPRSWTEAEVALTMQVANRCWEALERARVTRGLQESETRFRQIADVMPQVVWLARPDGSIFYFNRRWYEFTGLPEAAGGDDSFLPALHPDDRGPCLDRWFQSVRTGEPYEIRYRWKDGHSGGYRWFLGRAVPLLDDRGEIIRWYGTSTDIDDLVRADEAAREARAEAERANRAKDDFIAALSHELRTPLTPVLMAAEDLCDDPTLPPAMHDTLCMMRRNISLEAKLIDDLLDLTRISHDRLELRLQEVDAHSLLDLALEIVRDEAQAKGLTIEQRLEAECSVIRADPARLQQVFWNLLKNAVKFTPAGGAIVLRSRNEGSRLVIEVADSGIGIASEMLDRVFLPFEQPGLTNNHQFGGLGLGLSISRAIVERHQGIISAHSDGRGKGTTLRVELATVEPLPAGEGTRKGFSTRTAEGGAAGGAVVPMRLLVVEDHAPTLEVLTRLLRRAGHQVFTAASVSEARDVAEQTPLDLVLSDIGLPDGTGIELMDSLRRLHGLRGIALTGYGMEDDIRRAHDAGFVMHLTKPVSVVQLRTALAQLQQPSRSAR